MTLTEVLRQVALEGGFDPESVSRLTEAGRAGERASAPWFVRVLLGIGAWIAAAFLVLFLFAVDVVRDEAGAVVTGVLLLAGAIALGRARSSDFLQQLALAVWLVGEGLAIFGTGGVTEGVAAAALFSLVVQAATLRLYPDAVARFLATGFAVASVTALLLDLDLPSSLDVALLSAALPAGLLWWRRPAALAGPWAEAVGPVGHGLIVSSFVLLLSTFGDPFDRGGVGLLAEVGLTAGTAAMAWVLLGPRASRPPGLAVLGGILILGAATVSAPGVMAGVGALLLGFRARDRVLLGMAWVFLAVFLTGFYYDLEITLLEKSGLLVASGALLLGLREIVRRWT